MRSNPQESRLARAAAEGDGHAFAQLYDQFEKPIYNYCLRLLGNEHDAQDATQDAFLKLMRRLPEMGDRQLEIGPYLYTIARNASYDMIGKRKRAQPVDEITEDSGQLLGDGPPLDEDPVRSALLAADLDSIRAANARLPERQREVLALREIQGMSYEDIADLLEMNSNSVAQLISRARIRLRKELRGEAGAAIGPSGPDCERALPLLTLRQDGKLDQGTDSDWLDSHLSSCASCPLAAEAMAEAGLSYRAWAPVVPAAWLFRDTMAKAAEVVGADWSAVKRPAGGDQSGQAGPPRGRRRRLLAGACAVVVLVIAGLAANSLGGKPDEEAPQAATSETEPADRPAKATEPVADRSPSTSKKAGGSTMVKKTQPKKAPAPKSEPEPTPVTIAPAPTPSPASAASTPPAEPKPATRPARDRPDRGTGSWGVRTRPADRGSNPASPPTATPPPTTPPADPPTTTEQPEPTPPTQPEDPPPGGANQPPPTTPCLVRVCP